VRALWLHVRDAVDATTDDGEADANAGARPQRTQRCDKKRGRTEKRTNFDPPEM